MARQHIPSVGISLTLAAYFVMSLFSALNKAVQEAGFPASQVMFFDGLIGLLCVAGVCYLRRDMKGLKMQDPPLQLLLMALNVTGAYLTFQAYPHMPLVSAYLISFTGPLIIAALGALVLKERILPRQVMAIVFGFAGGVLALGPQEVLVNDAIIKMFAGICMFATSQVLVRKLSDTESVWSFPFYYYLGMVLLAVPLFHDQFVMPGSPRDWGMLLGLGVLDASALVMIYTGLKFAKVSAVAPFQYSCLLWVVLLDMVLWDKFPPFYTWAGAAIIVASGIFLVTYAHKPAKRRQKS
jgi:drug/metabolite transporter (DMT)-like permease